MASLKDAQALTQHVRRQADALHGALVDGDVDFKRIVALADELGDSADRLAATFQAIDEAFAERLRGVPPGTEQSKQDESTQDEPRSAENAASTDGSPDAGEPASTEETGNVSAALAPARRGRRNSGRGARAQSLTRQQLLQRAKRARIPRRSGMSKQQLIDALHAAGDRLE